jgi:Hpt domain.
MPPGSDRFEVMMAELRREFLDRLETDAQAIETAWSEAQAPDTRRRGLETLAFLAHRLAGLGRTFGHPQVTDCSLAVESAAEGQLGAAPGPGLAESVAALRTAISAASASS